MAGTKRISAGYSGITQRGPKVAKTDHVPKGKKGTKKKALSARSMIPTATFMTTASPIYANLTLTPPTTDPDAGAHVISTTADPGVVGNLTLVPSSFTTGSYGWKGSNRITVELQNEEDGKEKEKVQVMLTINAVVIGSKQAKDNEDGEETEGEIPGTTDREEGEVN